MIDVLMVRAVHCPVEVYDEGEAVPCDEDTRGWRWHDGGDHEPMLMQACPSHETDGAAGIAALVTERDALRATVAAVEAIVVDWGANSVHRPRSPHYRRLCAALAQPWPPNPNPEGTTP